MPAKKTPTAEALPAEPARREHSGAERAAADIAIESASSNRPARGTLATQAAAADTDTATAPVSFDEPAAEPLAALQDAAEGTLAMAALERIFELMRNGELRPGSIVNETDLAKRFGMSRGPVREAVRRLEGRKLVVREAYQRARVAPLDLHQIKEIFELRECLEGMACRLAARRMSDAALAAFLNMVQRADTRLGARSSYLTNEFKFNFHLAIVDACDNSRIQQVLTAEVYDLVRLYRWSSGAAPGRAGAAHLEHWQIGRAIANRDEDLAESLMRSHIQRSMQLLTDAERGGLAL